MKYVKFLFLFIFIEFSNYGFSQENILGGFREIYLWTINTEGTNTFSITGLGGIWDLSGYLSDVYMYNGNQYSIRYSEYTISGNSGTCWICGWDNMLAVGSYHNPPFFGYGIYKMKFASSSKSIYLNYSDWDYMHTHNGIYIYTNYDIYIQYDKLNDKIYYHPEGSDFIELGNNSYLKVWEMLPKNYNSGIQNTSGFNNYWQNCLALIPTSDNHPRLVWGPKPNFNSTSYRLYRKITTSSGQQINFISTTETSYIDNEFTIGTKNGQDFVEYWVKAMNDQNQESDETNHVNTQGISELQWKINQEIQNSTIDFKLNQNYPNPFNPATRISYSLKEDGLVTLKVYDVLGKEIATLVNENKAEGNYEVEFNASQLPSGMYIYKLQAGSFADVKKMILTK